MRWLRLRADSWLPRAALGLGAGAVLILYWKGLGPEGDTFNLVRESRATLACMAAGRWAGCTEAGQFPLLQKLVAFPLVAAGLKDGLVVRLLALASFAAFCGLLRLFARPASGRTPALSRLGVAALVASPLLWYARSSFGEMLATLVITAAVVAASTGASPLAVAALAMLASLSKDIAAPFVAALAVAAWLGSRESDGSPRSRGMITPLAAVLGALAGLALCEAYTWFRFAAWTNSVYATAAFRVSGPVTSAWILGGEWFSPQGGLLPFLPVATALAIVWAISAGARPAEEPTLPRASALSLGMGAGVLLALSLGFSRWFAPFGWIAWGDRLLLPWVPAVLWIASSHGAGRSLERAVGRFASPRAWAALGSALAVLSLPQFHVLFSETLMNEVFIAPRATCPEVGVQENAGQYFECLSRLVWNRVPALRLAYEPWTDPLAFALAVLCAWAWYRWLWRPITEKLSGS